MSTANGKPIVNKLTVGDIIDVMGAGVRDFRAAPKFGLFFARLYTVAGWLFLALLMYFGLPYLAYPLAMGFALISPFAAVGFYAVSDHLHNNKPLTWSAILGSIKAAAARDLRWMALVTGFALVLWMDIAAFLFFGLMGFSSYGPDFVESLFTTSTGLIFVVLGNSVGALIALLVFSISAVSFPMLYERDVDFVTAMTTSVRVVQENPKPMVLWCAIIAALIGISLLSVFAGLLLVLPVIGHATWHLYKRAVAPGMASANVAVAQPA